MSAFGLSVVVLLLGSVVADLALWTCDHVAQVQNFTFQQVVGGPWYLLEVISPVPGENRDRCTTVDFHNASGALQMRSRSFSAHSVVDETTEVKLYGNDSALWELPDLGSLARVVHVSADGQLMALTVCVSALDYDWTSVLGRNCSHDGLQEVRDQLRRRGLGNTDSPNTLRVSSCVYGDRTLPFALAPCH